MVAGFSVRWLVNVSSVCLYVVLPLHVFDVRNLRVKLLNILAIFCLNQL